MLYDMDAIEENQQAVEDGDAYYCSDCNELSEGRCCASCHVGLCLGCSEPVLRCTWIAIDHYRCLGPLGHVGDHSVYVEYWRRRPEVAHPECR